MANTFDVQIEDNEGNVYFPKTDLLKTQEEVNANTKAGKSVDALVVKEISSSLSGHLGGCSLEQEGENFYIVGADSVRKKLGSGGIQIKAVLKGIGSGGGTSVTLTVIDSDGNTLYSKKASNSTSSTTLSYTTP